MLVANRSSLCWDCVCLFFSVTRCQQFNGVLCHLPALLQLDADASRHLQFHAATSAVLITAGRSELVPSPRPRLNIIISAHLSFCQNPFPCMISCWCLITEVKTELPFQSHCYCSSLVLTCLCSNKAHRSQCDPTGVTRTHTRLQSELGEEPRSTRPTSVQPPTNLLLL